MERRFILTILEEDLDEKFKEDLEGEISAAITTMLNIEESISFTIEEN